MAENLLKNIIEVRDKYLAEHIAANRKNILDGINDIPHLIEIKKLILKLKTDGVTKDKLIECQNSIENTIDWFLKEESNSLIDTFSIARKSTLNRLIDAVNYLIEKIEKYSNRKRLKQLHYKVTFLILKNADAYHLAAALAEGLYKVFYKPNVEGVSASALTLSCGKPFLSFAISTYLSSIVLIVKSKLSKEQLTIIRECKYYETYDFKKHSFKNLETNLSFEYESWDSAKKDDHLFVDSIFIDQKIITIKEYVSIVKEVFSLKRVLLYPNIMDILIILATSNKKNISDIAASIPSAMINCISMMIELEPINRVIIETLVDKRLVIPNESDGTRKNTTYSPDEAIISTRYESNIPMITTPRDWFLNDGGSLEGGYLTTSVISVLLFNVISSKDYDNIFINVNYDLLVLLNKLQRVPFKINEKLLDWILNNYDELVSKDLLVDTAYANLSVKDLKMKIMTDLKLDKSKWYELEVALAPIREKVGKAILEKHTLIIADIFRGLKIYSPTFIDFRGRIYRAGIPNVQGSSLSRNLLMWADDNIIEQCTENTFDKESAYDQYLVKLALSVKKFKRISDALRFGEKLVKNTIPVDNSFEDPYEYAALVLVDYDGDPICLGLKSDHLLLHCRKDASASVYQIASIISGDIQLAKYCNVIPNKGHVIQDLYTNIYNDFIKWLVDSKINELDSVYNSITKKNKDIVAIHKSIIDLLNQKNSIIDRKLIKSIVMPFLYGITPFNASDKIRKTLIEKSVTVDNNDIPYILASLIFIFLKINFPVTYNIKMLLATLGFISSILYLPLIWDVGNFANIHQIYLETTAHKVNTTLKFKGLSKRSAIILYEKTDKPDPSKASASTPANFIHSKDAYILYTFLQKAFSHTANIATVHDCVITDWLYAEDSPLNYQESLVSCLKDKHGLIDNIIGNTFDSLFKMYKFKSNNNIEKMLELCNLPLDDLEQIYCYFTRNKSLSELKIDIKKNKEMAPVNSEYADIFAKKRSQINTTMRQHKYKLKQLKEKLNTLATILDIFLKNSNTQLLELCKNNKKPLSMY